MLAARIRTEPTEMPSADTMKLPMYIAKPVASRARPSMRRLAMSLRRAARRLTAKECRALCRLWVADVVGFFAVDGLGAQRPANPRPGLEGAGSSFTFSWGLARVLVAASAVAVLTAGPGSGSGGGAWMSSSPSSTKSAPQCGQVSSSSPTVPPQAGQRYSRGTSIPSTARATEGVVSVMTASASSTKMAPQPGHSDWVEFTRVLHIGQR